MAKQVKQPVKNKLIQVEEELNVPTPEPVEESTFSDDEITEIENSVETELTQQDDKIEQEEIEEILMAKGLVNEISETQKIDYQEQLKKDNEVRQVRQQGGLSA